MELRQLKYFVRAAELLNFTQAAKSVCIAESSLSVQIKQLETELGVALFKREKKRIELSEAGEKLLPHAKLIMANIQDASAVIQDVNEMRSGSLRIGGIFSLCSLLSNTLVPFSVKYPQIKVKIVCKSGKRLFEMLHNNELDFVLTFESPLKDEFLESMELFNSPLAVITHKDHPLAKQKQVSLKALQSYSLALPEKGMHVRQILEERFPDVIRDLNVQLELNDVNILHQLLCTRQWISIMPWFIEKDHSLLKATALAEVNSEIQAALYWRKGSYQRKAIKVFLDMFRNELNKSELIYYYKNKL